MYRTVSVKIKPTPGECELLLQTSKAFTDAVNFCIQYGWTNKTTSKRKIHDATYYPLKEKTGLPADVLIQAREKACEILKSANERRKKRRKVSKPVANFCPIRYNYKSSRVDFANNIASLSTLKGRIKVPLKLSVFHQQFTHGRYCTSDLIYRKDSWYLNIVLEFPTPEVVPATDCVGVDLGINRLAVTSQADFYSSKHLHTLVARHRRLRGDLQSKRSKSARKKLKKVSGYWRRLQRSVNHIISKHIVDACPKGFAIVMEDLTDIRKNTKHRKKQRGTFHSWAFRQLQEFIVYKAEAKGIPVLFIDSQNTSIRCCHCGHTSPGNRKSQSIFTCKVCGISLNADFNASQNIRQLGISKLSSLPVNQRNVGASAADKLTALAVSS